MKGAYILLIHLEEDSEIKVGKLGKYIFKRGYYVYVGSAMNNIEKRINRHLSKHKKLRWHIDYLLEHGKIVDVYMIPSEKKVECEIANKIKNFGRIVVKKFGSTDCRCESHLFYIKNPEILRSIFGS